MNNIRYFVLAFIMCSKTTIHSMEGSTSPIESTLSAGSGSSSSSSSVPKKSSLKKNARQGGVKKTLQFTADTQEHTAKTLREAKSEDKLEYQNELADIEKQQKAAGIQAAAVSGEEEALKKLISFAETTIPEVEQIINDCAKNIVDIWDFFWAVPTSREMASENFAKLGLAIKDYEKTSFRLLIASQERYQIRSLKGMKKCYMPLNFKPIMNQRAMQQ
jgi:hypothetical protein